MSRRADALVRATKYTASYAVGDYVEIWPQPLVRHRTTVPTESNGRTFVATHASYSPAEDNEFRGCYVLDLDAGDMRVPVVITGNDTAGFVVEGTNLYTDTEFAGANLMRVYRRDSAIGNPFGFAGGWLVSGNYQISSTWRSVKQLWYFWSRHYEPEYLLRWLQPDPIGPWGDRAQQGLTYEYATNAPSMRVDNSGLATSIDPTKVGISLKNCFIVRFFAVHERGGGIGDRKTLTDWFDWRYAYVRPWKKSDPNQAGLANPQDFDRIAQVGVAVEPTPNDPNCESLCPEDEEVVCTFSYWTKQGSIQTKDFVLPDAGYMPGVGSSGQDIDDTHTSAHVVHHSAAGHQGYDTDSSNTPNGAARSGINIRCEYRGAVAQTLVAVFDG